jgi:hypothetical protein
MGYLNNASVSVDAILTTKGRELLSQGTTNGLDIKYFALGDDEVNYDLWNPAHPLGSDYYGIIIENMPVLEASPIPEQNLKSKLITLPKNIPALVSLNVSQPNITFRWTAQGEIRTTGNTPTQTITVSTSDANYNNNLLGYTISYDSTYFVLEDASNPGFDIGIGGRTSTIGDSNLLTSIVVRNAFKIIQKAIGSKASSLAVTQGTANKTSLIYVDANEIGGRSTVTVNLSL